MIKVNAKNYKSVTKDLDFSKLSKSIQDAHKEYDDFVEFYDEDAEIKKMLNNHYQAIEKELNKTTTVRKKITKKEDKYRINLNEGSFQYDQYFSSSSLTVVRQSAKKKMQELLKYRPTDKSVWCTIDEMKNGSWEEIDRIKMEKKATKEKKTDKKPTPKKTTSKKASTRKVKQAKRKAIEVAVIPDHIRIMKRYLSLDGKKVTERQVTLFYRAIQRAAVEKKITKKTPHASLIKEIGDDLSSTYKEMENHCVFSIPEKLRKKVEKVVEDYGINPSVALIKRFINLYGGITPEKAERLLKSIANAKKNGKVQKMDSTYDRILEIEDHLERYIDSDKLIITDIQLNGLRGIAGMGK